MKLYSITFLTSLLLLSACGSEAEPMAHNIVYTPLDQCKEIEENDNAAFSVLDCGKVGAYHLSITQQSPIYFTVHLELNGKKRSSDFESLTGELPLEPGKTLEWHLNKDNPHFLIFRLSWGTANEPHNLHQYLTLHYISEEEICPLATIDARKTPNANQKARDLLTQEYLQTTQCPESVNHY